MQKVKYIKTKNHFSGCCNAPVKYKIIEDKEAGTFSSSPYCTKCRKFPTMKEEYIIRAKKMLDDGTLFE